MAKNKVTISPAKGPESWHLAVGLALVLLITTLVYWNHFDNAFHFDDSHTIVNNTYIRSLENIPLFFEDPTTFSTLPPNQSFRPMVTTSLAIDCYLSGDACNESEISSPLWFHISMFTLFLVQGVLMFFLFRHIFNRAYPHPWNGWVALFGTGWYLLHTVNAETINYIISRSDSYSTLFVVAALCCYTAVAQSKPVWRYLMILPMLLFFTLGFLTKEPALMFLPILGSYMLLFEWMPVVQKKTGYKQLIPSFVTLGITAIAAFGAYKLIMSKMPESFTPGGTKMGHYLITQAYVIFHYFTQFFLPTELSADTDLEVFSSVGDPRFIIGLLFIILMVGLVIVTMLRRHLRPIAFGIAWFFLALLPTSITPLSEVMNDHRMFFPFVGLMLAVSWFFGLFILRADKKINKRVSLKVAVITAAVLIPLAYGYGTVQRNQVWDRDITLWKDVTEKSPMNGRGWMNYGLALQRQGEYEQAMEAYNRSMELMPYYAYLHINMGGLLNAMGQPQEAEQYYKNALRYRPELPESHYFYAWYLYTQQRYNKAAYHLEKTLEYSPGYRGAAELLMDSYYNNSDWKKLKNFAGGYLQQYPNNEKAQNYLAEYDKRLTDMQDFEANVAANPTHDGYLELSLLYYKFGNYKKCIAACRKALELQPDSYSAYNNICSAYSELKQWQKAIKACENALRIKPDYSLAKNNLNWAKQQVGK